MKILQINIFGNLSTGRIATDLYKTLESKGHEGIVAFARNSIAPGVEHIIIGNKLSVYADGIMTRLTDRAGFFSKLATKRLIKRIEEYNPDIIHLHNLHGYYINIKYLFEYLKRCNKPVVWTLHDCWAFTGHCCYYSNANCDRFKTGCFKCPLKNTYPKSILADSSKKNYAQKRELFCSLDKLHLVCVSNWLSDEVEKSFLNKIPRRVIHNGIDTEIFRYTESDFKTRYGLNGKKIVLAVSTAWEDKRKGLSDVLRLSEMSDGSYAVVVVGVTAELKKKIDDKVIAITRTNSTRELAEIYSAADIFYNASIEETFGLPTVEAMACGTPVVVYDATAIPEVVTDSCGYVVEKNDVETVREIIKSDFSFDRNAVAECAAQYSKEIMMNKYLDTYLEILE